MKVILMSVGTRGDMEPFLAIAELLQERGCRVVCAFPEQFRDLAEATGIEFWSLGPEFIELLESDAGVAALGGSGSGLRKMIAYVRLALSQNEINRRLVRKQYELVENERPDRIVYNGKAAYPIIWGLDQPGAITMISPVPYMHFVKEHTHVAFNSNFGPFLNKLTYKLADFGMVTTLKITARWLKLPGRITRRRLKQALKKNRTIYTISPSLFPRPGYWKAHLQVLGYHEAKKQHEWEPDEETAAFLKKHERILFITFGSMTNPKPEHKTEILARILEHHRIPAVINTASGGLIRLQEYNRSLIHFVREIPYHWILPRTYAVIHHGGSGTTHLSLKYGCATMIIPHIIDQFVWNRIVSDLGTGPEGPRINRINEKRLESGITALWNNPSYKEKAEQIAGQMAQEDFRDELFRTVADFDAIQASKSISGLPSSASSASGMTGS